MSLKNKESIYFFPGPCTQLLMRPAELNCPDKDAAQILSLRILVLICDWLRDVAMTLYYGSLRHVPRTNRAGELVSCEVPGIPWRRRLLQSTQSVCDAFRLQRKSLITWTFKGTDSTFEQG